MPEKQMTTLLLHLDTLECLTPLTMEQRGRVITAIIAEYGGSEPAPELDAIESMAALMLKTQIDREYKRYLARCQKRRDAAEKRWADAKAAQTAVAKESFKGMQREDPVDAKRFMLNLDDA